MFKYKSFMEKTGVIAAFAAITFLLFTNNRNFIYPALFVFILLLTIVLLVKKFREKLKKDVIKSVLLFSIFTFLIHIFTNTNGRVALKVYFIIFSYEGIFSGLAICLKIILISILSVFIDWKYFLARKYFGKYTIIIACTTTVLPKAISLLKSNKNYNSIFRKVYKKVLIEYKKKINF